MYEIDAEKMSFSTLNELIRKTAQSDIVIHNCCGQRRKNFPRRAV